MADVFISYQHGDRAAAERVATRLKDEGLSTWWDTSLVAGDAWTDTIRAELRTAKVVVVLWSGASWASRWVQAEATAGHERGCLVTARLDDVALEPPFNIIQTPDLRIESDGLDRLVAGVRRRLGPVASAAPPLQPRSAEPMLAVLPFDNLSDDKNMQFFSDGVSEEIHYALTRSAGLGVIGRTSAFQFRGADKKKAAHELKATHILDGAVRKAGTRMRVNAELTEVSSGRSLWADRYDRDISDALNLQDEIASEVAAALKGFLPTQNGASTIDPTAYELFLRAQRLYSNLTDEEYEQAVPLLEQVVALSPNFARAWAHLAMSRASRLPTDHDAIGEPPHTAAIAAAHRALAIDPNCARAFQALAGLKPAFSEHAEKLQLIERAFALAPNELWVLTGYGGILVSVGRLKDAMPYLLRATALEPLVPFTAGVTAVTMCGIGRLAESIEMIEAARRRMPDSPLLWSFHWQILFFSGQFGDSEKLSAVEATAPPGMPPGDVSRVLGTRTLSQLPLPQREAALRARLDQNPALPIELPGLASWLGCADLAYERLFAALDSHRPIGTIIRTRGVNRSNMALFLFGFVASAMRRDIRFPRLCARLGLVEYWRTSGHWPDCATEVPYDFKVECEKVAASGTAH